MYYKKSYVYTMNNLGGLKLCKAITYSDKSKRKLYNEDLFAQENLAHWCSKNPYGSSSNIINKIKNYTKEKIM